MIIHAVISNRKEVCQRSKKPQLISFGYISSLVARQHSDGRKWCPWRLSVGEGRYVRLVLVSMWKRKSRSVRQVSAPFSFPSLSSFSSPQSSFSSSSSSSTTSESFNKTSPTTLTTPETPHTKTTFSHTQTTFSHIHTTPYKRIRRNAWYKSDENQADVIKHGVHHVGSIKTNRLHPEKSMIKNILQNYVTEPFSGFCHLVGVVFTSSTDASGFSHNSNKNKNINNEKKNGNNKNNIKMNENNKVTQNFEEKNAKSAEMEKDFVTENKNNEVVLKLHICDEEKDGGGDDNDANKKMFYIDKENEKEPRIMKIINNNYKKNKNNNNKNNNKNETLNKLLDKDIYLQMKHHYHNHPPLHHHTTRPSLHHHAIHSPSYHHTIHSAHITIIFEDNPSLPDFLLHFQGNFVSHSISYCRMNQSLSLSLYLGVFIST